MKESRKEKILNKLKQARETGQLKTESIRDIVRTAVTESVSEIKEGRAEIRLAIAQETQPKLCGLLFLLFIGSVQYFTVISGFLIL